LTKQQNLEVPGKYRRISNGSKAILLLGAVFRDGAYICSGGATLLDAHQPPPFSLNIESEDVKNG